MAHMFLISYEEVNASSEVEEMDLFDKDARESHEKHHDFSDKLGTIGMAMVLCLGVIGHILSLVVMLKHSNRKTSWGLCLATLSVSDLIVISTGLLRYWIKFSFEDYDIRTISNEFCKMHSFLTVSFIDFSTWILCLLTFERYVSVRFPMRIARVCSRKNTKYTLIGLFIATILLNGHIFHTKLLLLKPLKNVNETISNLMDDLSPELQNITILDARSTLLACKYRKGVSYFFKFIWPWVVFAMCSGGPFAFILFCNLNIGYILAERKFRRFSKITKANVLKMDTDTAFVQALESRSQICSGHERIIDEEGHAQHHNCQCSRNSFSVRSSLQETRKGLHNATLYFLPREIVNRIGALYQKISKITQKFNGMTMGITMTFFLSTGPILVYEIIKPYITESMPKDHMAILFNTLKILQYAHHSLSFYLYCLTGATFRKELAEIIRLMCCSFQYKFKFQRRPTTSTAIADGRRPRPRIQLIECESKDRPIEEQSFYLERPYQFRELSRISEGFESQYRTSIPSRRSSLTPRNSNTLTPSSQMQHERIEIVQYITQC